MTPELQRRLRCLLPPFDGMCIHNAEGLSLAELRELLELAIFWLEPRYPIIRSFRDWHEHDGFLVGSKSDSWDTLIAVAATEQTLLDSRDEDWQVRTAFYSKDFEWLLRYCVDLENEADVTTAWCNFDLTLALRTNASELVNELLGRLPNAMVKSEATSWFLSRYGG